MSQAMRGLPSIADADVGEHAVGRLGQQEHDQRQVAEERPVGGHGTAHPDYLRCVHVEPR
jgi:hypothetical protein